MPERCPFCNAECSHMATHCPACGAHVRQEMLRRRVEMLEGAIEGWRAENARLQSLAQSAVNALEREATKYGKAQARIAELEGVVERLVKEHDEKYRCLCAVSATNTEYEARIADLEAALETISKYGDGSICPYGCDTPDIASAALAAKETDE